MAEPSGVVINPRLDVIDGDVDTVATCTLEDPDGAVVPLTVATADAGKTWTGGELTLTAPGRWYLRWTVTGSGSGPVPADIVDVDPPDTVRPHGPCALAYATSGDLAYRLRRAPTSEEIGWLYDASREIDRLIMCARYRTDDTGRPVDACVAAALRDATTELAAWWSDTGNYTGANSQLSAASIASVSLSWGGRNTKDAQADRIGSAVWSILASAGLLARGPMTYG